MTGGGTSTTTTPGAIDTEKAGTAELMRMFLMPGIMSGMKGQPTTVQEQTLQNLQQQAKYYAGRMGINPGESVLKESERLSNEQLTKPNDDMLKQAMAMYGYSSDVTGGAEKRTEQHTNLWDYVGILASVYGGK